MVSSEKLTVVIPAHNEEETIGSVIDGIRGVLDSAGFPYEIIVVNDGSTDRTYEVVKEKGVKVLNHEKRKGYGAAIKTGISLAQSSLIVIIDADGSYPAEAIPTMVKMMGAADMVVGARVGAKIAIPLARKPAKFVLTKFANYVSGFKIPDLNSGLRVFKKQQVNCFIFLLPDGFSFTATLTLAFLCYGLTVKFIPINYYERKGKSKIRPLSDTIGFFSLMLKLAIYLKPLKVLAPIFGFLLTVGLTVFIYQLILFRDVAELAVLLILAALLIGILGLISDMIATMYRHFITEALLKHV